MNTHRFNFSIRNSVGYAALAAAASLAIMFVFASVAHSREIKLGGFYSQAQVRGACINAGGTSWSTSGRFGCVNGSNGTSVTCTNGGECTGTVPGRTAPGKSPGQVLAGSSGLSTTSGASMPQKSGRVFGDGILGTRPGMGPSGPAATGSPASTGGAASASSGGLIR